MASRLPLLWSRCARTTPLWTATRQSLPHCRLTKSSAQHLHPANLPTRSNQTSSRTRTPTSLRHSISEPPKYSHWHFTAQVRPFSTSSVRCQRKYIRFNIDPNAPLDWRRWDLPTKIVVAVTVSGFVYFVIHLERVPETGRWRFMDMSPKFEAELAEEAYKQLLEEFQGKILPSNHVLSRHIRRVVVNILDSNDLGHLKEHDGVPAVPLGVLSKVLSSPSGDVNGTETVGDVWDPDASSPNMEITSENVKNTREWTLLVVNDDKVPNASASYGHIVVFTGILGICKDEQGLAAVLGHEIGHVVARHSSERVSYGKVLLAFATFLQFVGLDFSLARIAITFILALPHSRRQEREADKIGLRLTSKACYDPHAAIDVHTRLAQLDHEQGRLNVNFLYTHPTGASRVKAIQDMLPEAYAIQAASPKCESVKIDYDAFRIAVPTLV